MEKTPYAISLISGQRCQLNELICHYSPAPRGRSASSRVRGNLTISAYKPSFIKQNSVLYALCETRRQGNHINLLNQWSYFRIIIFIADLNFPAFNS